MIQKDASKQKVQKLSPPYHNETFHSLSLLENPFLELQFMESKYLNHVEHKNHYSHQYFLHLQTGFLLWNPLWTFKRLKSDHYIIIKNNQKHQKKDVAKWQHLLAYPIGSFSSSFKQSLGTNSSPVFCNDNDSQPHPNIFLSLVVAPELSLDDCRCFMIKISLIILINICITLNL